MRAEDLQEVTTNDTDIVSALKAAIAAKVGRQRYELWFGAATQFTLRDGTLLIESPSQFFQDWLRVNFRKEIESCCLETLGFAFPLEFQVAAGDALQATACEPAGQPGPAEACSTTDSADATTASSTAPSFAADVPVTSTDASGSRRKFARFGTFIVGPNNRLAQASAQTAAERPGSISPLYLYGPTGVGKTHLLEAIWTAAKTSRRACPVYLSAEQFTTLFLDALHGSGLPNFRRKYRGVDLLIIDDVQFFRGKRATLVELLHTIDTLLREGKQLVLAGDAAPADLRELGPELSSRLHGGLACRIGPADLETRMGIVRRFADELKVGLPEAVLEFVAGHLTSHARELWGALLRLQATSQALHKPISLALAEEALADMIRHSAPVVRLADIERAVCDAFGLERESLQSGRKARQVSHPRMLAMWLARKYTRAALSEIGHYFGRRSHSTVVSAQKKISAWMAGGEPLQLADHRWSVDDAIRKVEEKLRVG